MSASGLVASLQEHGFHFRTALVYRWETGEFAPAPALVPVLSSILGLHSDVLVTREPAPEPAP